MLGCVLNLQTLPKNKLPKLRQDSNLKSVAQMIYSAEVSSLLFKHSEVSSWKRWNKKNRELGPFLNGNVMPVCVC